MVLMLLQGKPISPGYAAGIAFVSKPSLDDVPRRPIAAREADREWRRFEEARDRSATELATVRRRVLHDLGKPHARIFDFHLALLRDKQLNARVRERIRTQLVNAEQALAEQVGEICDRMTRTDDAYMREREQDIRDVGRRILSHLAGAPAADLSSLPEGTVLAAVELMPSDTLNLDRAHVAAVITEQGGETSHAAILARALGAPAITGITDLMSHVRTGMRVLVDGETGTVLLSPSGDQSAHFEDDRRRYQARAAAAQEAENHPCRTFDGIAISLQANIGRAAEAEQVVRHRLDGVGLLRTEFMFLDAPRPPERDLQHGIYRQVAEALGGRPLVARTLDVAPDKRPRFLEARGADRRALAFRGLRFSLEEGELFETQVTAITLAATEHDVRILLPMVVDPHDVSRAIGVVDEAARRCDLARRPLVGAMIETPAAIAMLDDFIEQVDFLSIGTNDLTQFMLAVDRAAIGVTDSYSVLHPAVLRAIRCVVERARAADRPLCLCGEAAGDPRIACLLVGLGVTQLSMSPARTPSVRYALCGCHGTDLERVAQAALVCRTAEEVRELVDRSLRPEPQAPQSPLRHAST
jgi:phosphotransferase system enzyme I (PtsI)